MRLKSIALVQMDVPGRIKLRLRTALLLGNNFPFLVWGLYAPEVVQETNEKNRIIGYARLVSCRSDMCNLMLIEEERSAEGRPVIRPIKEERPAIRPIKEKRPAIRPIFASFSIPYRKI